MRIVILAVVTLMCAGNALAQPVPWRSPVKHAQGAEIAVQQAVEQLGRERKIVEREETVAWLKVQRLIGDHLTELADIQSGTLRASMR